MFCFSMIFCNKIFLYKKESFCNNTNSLYKKHHLWYLIVQHIQTQHSVMGDVLLTSHTALLSLHCMCTLHCSNCTARTTLLILHCSPLQYTHFTAQTALHKLHCTSCVAQTALHTLHC